MITSHGGKPTARLQAGGTYNITLKFGTPRRALLTASAGSLAFPGKPRSRTELWYGQAGIRGCVNRLAFGQQAGYAASKALKARLSLPKGGGGSVTLVVVSARSDSSALMLARLTLPVQPSKAGGSSSSSGGRSPAVRGDPVG